MVNTQWLASFLAVAELGNFTRGAERLGLTQSAVSQHLKHLEDQFGQLIIRRPRQLELTPAGMALRDYGEQVERAERVLKAHLGGTDTTCGEVGIITPGSIGLALYPRLLDFQQDNPGVAIRHRFAPDSEVLDAVLNNHFDFGILTFRPDDERLQVRAFMAEPLELVLPASAHYDGWQTLNALGFIDHPDGQAMATRLLSRRYPGCPGIRSMPVNGFSNQVSLILEPVARGLGFTVLPRFARQAFTRQSAIQVVECGDPIIDTLNVIYRAEWPLSARADRTLKYLERVMKTDNP